MIRINRKINFYISIASLVVFLVITLTGLYLWTTHRASSVASVNMADRLFGEITGRIVGKYHLLLGSVKVLTDSGSNIPDMVKEPEHDGLSHSSIEFMFSSVNNFKYVSSVYTGYNSGNFIQVIPTRGNPLIFSTYKAPEETHLIVRTISTDDAGNRTQYWRFLNKNRLVIGDRTEENPGYDPRKRPWYEKGLISANTHYTEPYIFDSSNEPGITCSRFIPGKEGVFGVDISLSDFSMFLNKQHFSENGKLFLFDSSGSVTARSTTDDKKSDTLPHKEPAPVETVIINAFISNALKADRSEILPVDGSDYLVRISDIGSTFGVDQRIGVAAPIDDFTGHIKEMKLRIFIVTMVILIITLPSVIWASRKVSRSLMRLADEARKIQAFDFSESEPFSSVISEIHDLIQAFSIMKVTIRERTDALIATQKKLETLVEQGIALAAEQDINTLVEMIFLAAKELASADGGILYIKDNGNCLSHEIVRIDSTGFIFGGTSGNKVPFDPIPIIHPDTGKENHSNLACHVFLTGKTIHTDNVYDTGDFDFTNVYTFDKTTGFRTKSLLTVPIKPRQGDTLGVLQLINHSDDKTGGASPFNSETTGFVEALAAQAAVSLDNRNLVIAQINLFDAFIQLMAGAIDAKSPYTGGHCARVPELACMLAEEAGKTNETPFENFRLQDDDEWHEFRVAAWLHDCGKVTTPEFVVDKSTKLETIYNRIHEIRARFEVLLRDAEIAYYQKRLEGNYSKADLDEELKQSRQSIINDFSFIASCNVGGEFMTDDDITRIKTIASRTWVRHLDDRLGLSDEEIKHLKDFPAPALPCEESLLSDKHEHITKRVSAVSFQNQISGFNMEVPEHLYNNGEVYNLSIRKGTLNDEERFKINEHIIQTIIMLEKLPFPKHLARVPEFAGAHHETMDGKGYPRKLNAEEMSLPAKIMAISDIFEALTASDRPYKKAKSVNESLKIMGFMRDDHHIDADLFNLFLKSGVYSRYADQFLTPEQNDRVDINRYLTK